MVVTAYCACQKCTGWRRKVWTWPPFRPVYTSGKLKGQRKKVGITADGTRARSPWLWRKGTIAADITKYPFGTRMYVPGYGWGVVHDVGSAIKGNHIDVFFPSHRAALKWGRKTLVVTVVR
ncbi:3D domain-containing protein [candidate division NPL-UPA2 bacterium]|nr:3D domain-containing protein [candidate division NPL-UPA2 bacterium]